MKTEQQIIARLATFRAKQRALLDALENGSKPPQKQLLRDIAAVENQIATLEWVLR